ncbi:glycoside hydrolase family 73 protein [Jeotgalibaca ciconiae]|uniref:N-acetylmuramoyl-L-alanine amidase n=1 Tax=Jeotgalibaca ciconiae TaxID=2496265 RepID=A0A3Q9BME7_9LACT|nr:glycoside hydrolase family 73 protein [Jeotgalibaca ciconiae]AZP04638.1 N-acetylmuramoyl-L-alanine amidase [Jeotgalibaca ciconiae]
MAKKKLKKRTKHKIQAVTKKMVQILFGVLILYMAGQALTTSYRSTFNNQENSEAEIESHGSFIETIAPIAQAMQERYGVRASLSIAQAILESDWGTSDLAAQYNNLYGVKGGDGADVVALETQEFSEGEWITIFANFKVYESYAASIEDHALLMVDGTTWNNELYHSVIEAPTYQEAARAIHQAGYATDPDYPEKLIQVIEEYELYKYD